jgi:hypothetical protein
MQFTVKVDLEDGEQISWMLLRALLNSRSGCFRRLEEFKEGRGRSGQAPRLWLQSPWALCAVSLLS